MRKPTLTIFANFRINNEERLQRMKDSFESFKEIDAEKWVINIRGKFKKEAMSYLKSYLSKKLISYELESKSGWFFDSRFMLKDILSDFVFFWIEDHINMIDVKKYNYILKDMKDKNIDHLIYSWWHDGYKDKFNSIENTESDNLLIYDLNPKSCSIIEKYFKRYFYTISAVSITKKEFFKKILLSDHPTIKRWSIETPFDFEKKSTDYDFLPFTHAIPKYELFASIDDNHGTIGYSLIDRGLYPNRVAREDMLKLENKSDYKQLNTNILLSVIIPNYNNSKYLSKCLDSVINQTYKNLEIIIVDDCSTDNSIELINTYLNKDRRIRLIANKINYGVAKSRDIGIKSSLSRWITTLDSDDYYLTPLKIEKEMEIISKNSHNGTIAYSGIVHVDEMGNDIIKIMTKQNIKEGYLFKDMITRNFAIPRDFIFSKEIYNYSGGYDYNIPLYEDWDLKIRLSKEAHFYYSGIDGIAYRRHRNGLSSANKEEHRKWLKYVFNKNTDTLEDKSALEGLLNKNLNYNKPLDLETKHLVVNNLINQISQIDIDSFSIFGVGELTDLFLVKLALLNIHKRINYIIDSKADGFNFHDKKVISPTMALHNGEKNFILLSYSSIEILENILIQEANKNQFKTLHIIKYDKGI